MKRCHVLALAAVLSAGVAAPAMAAWDHIGSVEFSRGDNHETEYGTFGGSVEALALQAQRSDVMCRRVMATFGNGETREVFHGPLPRGQNVTVDLPGRERMVKRLDFDCRSANKRGATVNISANVGRYQNEWRQSPDWQRTWSRKFNWNTPGDRNDNDRDGRNRDRDRF